MSDKLNKILFQQIKDLKRCDQLSPPDRVCVIRSPFDDEDDDNDTKEAGATSAVDKTHKLVAHIYPISEIYKEAAYSIELSLHKMYPIEPPDVRFLTPVYHPNVDIDGKFCHEVLKKTVDYKMNTTLVEIVKAVVHRIDNPEVDQSMSFAVGKQYADEPAEFKRIAAEYVQKHGLPRI